MKRVIPCLLLDGEGLVKTVRFRKPVYVGDPINTVRIFNEKEVDELIFLDIKASAERRGPNFTILERIANESFMPLGYGGGVSTYEHAARLYALGMEKVILNSAFHSNPKLVEEISKTYGTQAIVVALDIKRGFFGAQSVYRDRGRKRIKQSIIEVAKKAEGHGAGELFLNNIDRDGVMNGYDLDLIHAVSDAVSIPVVCCGGAGNIEHLKDGLAAGASAVAAGSMFVFKGPHRAVLISYPKRSDLI